jgi:hypothetical protein
MTLIYLEDGTISLLFSKQFQVSTLIHDKVFSSSARKIVDLKDRLKCPTADRQEKPTKKRSRLERKVFGNGTKKHVQVFSHLSFITLTTSISEATTFRVRERESSRKLRSINFVNISRCHRLTVLTPTRIDTSPMPYQCKDNPIKSHGVTQSKALV